MGEDGRVVCVRAGQRVESDPSPGIVRERAIAVDGLWSGLVTTEPGMVSGWHHHGDYETSLYVLEGGMRMEFGPGGTDVVEAGTGDFLHVPRGAIHRESNPGTTPARAVITRAGHGPVTVNVDGPAAGR